MIPIWLAVLALGVVLIIVEVTGESAPGDLPDPHIVPSSDEDKPAGAGVDDNFSDI
jgi:hypothetical protein